MKTVTVADFPADQLPTELRLDFEPGARVKVTLEQTSVAEPAAHRRRSLLELLSGPSLFKDEAELDAHIEELRGPHPSD